MTERDEGDMKHKMIRLIYYKDGEPRYYAMFPHDGKGVPYTETQALQIAYEGAMRDLNGSQKIIECQSQVEAAAEFKSDCDVYDAFQRSLGR